MATQDNTPIISYEHGFFISNTDAAAQGLYGPGKSGLSAFKIDPPNLLSFMPPVSNSVGGNIARRSGFDTLSSGTVPSNVASSIIGILSTKAAGQNWGCRDVTGSQAASAVGVLWNLPNGQTMENNSGTYAQRSAAGIAGNGTSTRKIHLSTGFVHEDKHLHQRTTTILTHLSCDVDLAIVYHDGSTAMYSLSADATMENSRGSDVFNVHSGLSARGQLNPAYNVFTQVGPNIRRLVALGYR